MYAEARETMRSAVPEHAALRRWYRWGTFDFHTHSTPHPICFAAAFDPDGWKRLALDMVQEAGIELRLHSWFSHTLVEDGRVTGVVCESKSGPQAILGQVVIDTTGDLDVAASAGAPHTQKRSLVSHLHLVQLRGRL